MNDGVDKMNGNMHTHIQYVAVTQMLNWWLGEKRDDEAIGSEKFFGVEKVWQQ